MSNTPGEYIDCSNRTCHAGGFPIADVFEKVGVSLEDISSHPARGRAIEARTVRVGKGTAGFGVGCKDRVALWTDGRNTKHL